MPAKKGKAVIKKSGMANLYPGCSSSSNVFSSIYKKYKWLHVSPYAGFGVIDKEHCFSYERQLRSQPNY